MLYVDPDILQLILVRLPAKSLFRFRSVCKKWLLIIDDSDFIKFHTIFNQQFYASCHQLLVRNKTGAPLYSFNLDSLNFISGPQMIDATLIKHSIHLRVPNLLNVAFCNGLILKPGKKFWAIYNPLTKESRELPEHSPNPTALHLFFGYGLGYVCAADDYRVVRINREISQGKYVFPTFIYSLKFDSWRRITQDCPCGLPWQSRATYMDGVLYWLSDDIIVALHLSTETFIFLSLPPVNQGNIICRIASQDRCLICCVSTINHFDVWVMEDDDENSFWNKKFSWEISGLKATPVEIWVVAYLKEKEQVVLQYEWGFFWCDIKNNSAKKFSIHGFPRITSAQICPGSLVRLNVHGGAIERTSTRKRRRTKRRDTRLKLCVRDHAVLCCSDNGVCIEGKCLHCELKEE